MAEIIASLGRINLVRSNRSPPDWSIVNTSQAVSNLVDIICLEVTKNDAPSQEGSPPSLYIDIQLVDDHTAALNSQAQPRGTISLMQIYLLPQDHNEPGHIYLLDVLTLGNQVAFETPRSVDLDLERLYAGGPSRGAQAHSKVTLRTILESPTIPKVFFDVRADAETLSLHYGISLAGVQDLQLMEFAARSICPLGSELATSSSSASASSAGGRSHIRRSSRSRSGSATPPQHQHYPLSPPATPSSHTILDSVESSPSSVCSRESFASEASTATTVSLAISTTARAPKTSSAFEPAIPPQGTSLPLSRTRRRSLRNLNNLPRCITRDLNLPLLEQLAFAKWQSVQRKREQVSIANRELERLNQLMTPSSGRSAAQSASVSHSGLPLSRQHRTKRAIKESSERYQLLTVEREVDICARPLRKEAEWVRDLLGLVVLNVRYLPALWGEYDRRMRTFSVAEGGSGAGSGAEGELLREREQIWRKRVEEGVKERLESARAGAGEGYTSLSSFSSGEVGLKGRGKLVMLPPSGWE